MALNEAGTVTLSSRQKSSPLWIILLLVSRTMDHGMMSVNVRAAIKTCWVWRQSMQTVCRGQRPADRNGLYCKPQHCTAPAGLTLHNDLVAGLSPSSPQSRATRIFPSPRNTLDFPRFGAGALARSGSGLSSLASGNSFPSARRRRLPETRDGDRFGNHGHDVSQKNGRGGQGERVAVV